MSQKQCLTLCVLLVIASFVGGVFSQKLVFPLAFARDQATPTIVTANQFRLLDSEGNVRGMFSMSPNGNSPGLLLFDKNGVSRVVVDLHPDGSPGIGLKDKNRNVRLQAALGKDGDPAIELNSDVLYTVSFAEWVDFWFRVYFARSSENYDLDLVDAIEKGKKKLFLVAYANLESPDGKYFYEKFFPQFLKAFREKLDAWSRRGYILGLDDLGYIVDFQHRGKEALNHHLR